MRKYFVSLTNRVAELRSDDRGVTSVEYGLMVALIAAVIIGTVTILGNNLSTLFGNIATTIGGVL
jgi:pilus assembly protein Flp/PilA